MKRFLFYSLIMYCIIFGYTLNDFNSKIENPTHVGKVIFSKNPYRIQYDCMMRCGRVEHVDFETYIRKYNLYMGN